jgi:uncharacterized protein YueI
MIMEAKPTQYEKNPEERRAYQRAYRERNLEEVRKLDRERKRTKTTKGEPTSFKVEKNVKVRFE